MKTKEKPYFVLQRINHGVFKDVPGLIENKIAVSNHIQEKLKDLSSKKRKRRVLTFAKTKLGGSYLKDEGDNWYF